MNSLLLPVNEDAVDYERDKAIDVTALHEEWFRQPELVGKYNRLLAQSQRDVDLIKRKIELCKASLAESRARLEIKIRKDPEAYDPPLNKKGEISTTEAWFNSVLLLEQRKDPDCIESYDVLDEAQAALIEANYKVSVYNAGAKTMADKKPALENAVLLWTRAYFAVPNLPRPVAEEYMNIQDVKRDEAVAEIREKIQSKEKTEEYKTRVLGEFPTKAEEKKSRRRV